MKTPEQELDVYLVGGAVRDAMLGLEVKDRDWVVVGATPQRMQELGFKPVGRDFPVFLHPSSKEEYALARTERKTGPGYHGFEFVTTPNVTLEEDLMRRDLTINAMAQTRDGELVDYFGGAKDLASGILRHVSPAFGEDPVRVLRVARFAARYDFRVAAETSDLMRRMVVAGEVDALVAERVWQETVRALAEPVPSRFIAVLRDCGALVRVFPEIDALFGVPQAPAHHPEIDTGVHTMMVLDQAARLSADTEVRFAALVHDLGKALTPKDELPSHHQHEHSGLVPIRAMCERLRVPKEHRDLALIVCEYHLTLHKIAELRPATIVKLLESIDAFRRPVRVEKFALACAADKRGRTGHENDDYPQQALLRQCYEAAARVDAAALAAKHRTGIAIAEALHEARCRAVQAVMTPAAD